MRPVIVGVAVLVLPFLVYGALLWLNRLPVADAAAWSVSRLTWLLAVGLVLMVGSLLALAEFGGAPPRSTYVPAHVDAGKVEPGVSR
jgi:hypothetical protein